MWRELSRVRRCRHSPSSPPTATVVAAPSPVGAQVVSPGSGSDGAVRRNAGHAATLQSTAYPDVRTCHESFRRGVRVSAAQPCYGTRTIGADGKVRSRIARARAAGSILRAAAGCCAILCCCRALHAPFLRAPRRWANLSGSRGRRSPTRSTRVRARARARAGAGLPVQASAAPRAPLLAASPRHCSPPPRAAPLSPAVASALVALNLAPRDGDGGLALCGVFGKNRWEWSVAQHAMWSQSVCSVPLYDTLGASAVAFIVAQTGMRTVFCSKTETVRALAARGAARHYYYYFLPTPAGLLLLLAPRPTLSGQAAGLPRGGGGGGGGGRRERHGGLRLAADDCAV